MDNVHSVRLMKSSTLESKPFPSRNFWLSQAKRTAEAFRIQTAIPNRFRRRTFHVLIGGLWFGSWKYRRLNWALNWEENGRAQEKASSKWPTSLPPTPRTTRTEDFFPLASDRCLRKLRLAGERHWGDVCFEQKTDCSLSKTVIHVRSPVSQGWGESSVITCR